MTQQTHDVLKELQKVDETMSRVRTRIESFDPLLEEVEEPVVRIETELEALRSRLDEMRSDARRLERGAEEKKERAEKLESRMRSVQNVREEAAVRTELDLVRRARDADEKEALGLLDLIQRSEIVEEELEGRLEEARAEVEPRRRELEEERKSAVEELEALEKQHAAIVSEMDSGDRRLYESFRAGGRSVVLAHLMEDGACGNCFGMVPLQVQNEIRQGRTRARCESCGVMLAPPESEEAG